VAASAVERWLLLVLCGEMGQEVADEDADEVADEDADVLLLLRGELERICLGARP
jgi:hypothetical protein